MKRLRFRNASFDIAPKAQRYTATAWGIFGLGLLIFLACAWVLARSLQGLQDVHASQANMRAERQAHTAAERSAQARLSDPIVMERAKGQQRLQQMIRMSWFGLFDALETAAHEVRGGVSILSLVPSQAQTGTMQVRLTAMAVNAPLMLEYMRVLRKDPRILAAELNSQQPDDNVGPGVIRMQLNVVWNPQSVVQAPSWSPSKPLDQNLVAGGTVARDPVAKVLADKVAP